MFWLGAAQIAAPNRDFTRLTVWNIDTATEGQPIEGATVPAVNRGVLAVGQLPYGGPDDHAAERRDRPSDRPTGATRRRARLVSGWKPPRRGRAPRGCGLRPPPAQPGDRTVKPGIGTAVGTTSPAGVRKTVLPSADGPGTGPGYGGARCEMACE